MDLLVDLTAAAFPVGCTQLAFEYLAGAGKRKWLTAKLDTARAFVAGDQAVAVGDELFGGCTASPQVSSGMPMTAHCDTTGCWRHAFSTSTV